MANGNRKGMTNGMKVVAIALAAIMVVAALVFLVAPGTEPKQFANQTATVYIEDETGHQVQAVLDLSPLNNAEAMQLTPRAYTMQLINDGGNPTGGYKVSFLVSGTVTPTGISSVINGNIQVSGKTAGGANLLLTPSTSATTMSMAFTTPNTGGTYSTSGPALGKWFCYVGTGIATKGVDISGSEFTITTTVTGTDNNGNIQTGTAASTALVSINFAAGTISVTVTATALGANT